MRGKKTDTGRMRQADKREGENVVFVCVDGKHKKRRKPEWCSLL
jgi:hypothetical protein